MRRALRLIEDVIIGAFLTGALLAGMLQVVLRYVFNTGFVWTEGLVVVLTIWAALMGASRAVAERLHVRVDIAVERMPPRWRQGVELLAHTIALAYSGLLCYCGVLYVDFLLMTRARAVDSGLPLWLVYAIVPLAMGMFVLRYADEVWRTARGEDDAGRGGGRAVPID